MIYTIQESSDYLQYRKLFETSGLEFNTDETGTRPEGFLTSFCCLDESRNLIGAVAITRKKGYFVINDIAVISSMRKQKLGEVLLNKSIEYIYNLGGKEIYITAKAPGFFAKYGFQHLELSDVPDIFGCLKCPQYGSLCTPKFMKLEMPNKK